VNRIAEQTTVGVEQAIVDRPGIDAGAVDPAGEVEAVQYGALQVKEVPVEGAVDAHRAVPEAVQLA